MPQAASESITRRDALAGAAATFPATAVPAFALPVPDPILAAIEAHRAAVVVHSAAVHAEQGIEAASSAMDDACCAMLDIVPATLDGVLALLRYVNAANEIMFAMGLVDDAGKEREWYHFLFANLIASLETTRAN